MPLNQPIPGTDMQRLFATAFVELDGNAQAAAIKAGYSGDSARVTAYKLLRNPNVQALIRSEQFLRLQGPLTVTAIATLESAMTSDDVPWGVRVEAAKTVLDRAGIPAQKAFQIPGAGGAMGAGDLEGLQAFIQAGQAALQRRQRAREALTVEQSPGDLGQAGESAAPAQE